MSFIFKRVLQKLWNRKKIYISIILQIAIGIFIINIFFNLSLKINLELKTLLESNRDQEFYITAEYKNNQIFNAGTFDIVNWSKSEPVINEYASTPFPSYNLDILKMKFSDFRYELETIIPLDILNTDMIDQYLICYSSNNNTVKMSRSVYDNLNNLTSYQIIIKRDFPFRLLEDSLITLDGDVIPIVFLPTGEKTIYMPINIYDNLYHPKNLIRTKLKVILNDSSYETSNQIPQIIEELEAKNNLFSYSINSEYFTVLNKVNTAYDQASAFDFIGVVLFIILLIGLSGLFALIINTRKKEIAISLALGSTKKRLYFECIIEMLSLSFLGCFIGSLVSLLFLINGVVYATVTITPSITVMMAGMVISCLIAFIATIPAFITIKILMPIEILRTE